MTTQSPSINTFPELPTAPDRVAAQAAHALGKLLFDTPECQAYLKAIKEINSDVDVQRVSANIREHETALQWGKGNRLEHQAALTTLEAELEALPSVHAYHQAEKAAAQLFHAVDEVISQAAGILFAPNAKRSGCGCGG